MELGYQTINHTGEILQIKGTQILPDWDAQPKFELFRAQL